MEISSIVIILLPIAAGLLGSYLTYYFTIKSRKNEAILKFKEEKYANLLVLLQGFVGKTASRELKKQFFEEQYKSWLYSSDDVVEAINEMILLIMASEGKMPDPQKGKKAVGNVVLAMRKDLLGKTKLGYNQFFYTDVVKEGTENEK